MLNKKKDKISLIKVHKMEFFLFHDNVENAFIALTE